MAFIFTIHVFFAKPIWKPFIWKVYLINLVDSQDTFLLCSQNLEQELALGVAGKVTACNVDILYRRQFLIRLFQFLSRSLQMAWEHIKDGPCVRTPDNQLGDKNEASGFGWAQSWPLWPSAEWPSRWNISLHLLSVTYFQINKYF